MKDIMKEKVTKQYFLFLALWTAGHMATSAIYSTFLIQHGMSLFQVNLCNAVFFSFLFLCEIPTGAFADIFGRKRSFVLACIVRGLSEICYGLSTTISGFIVSEIIAAIGFTFMNGALKSWFVDSLIHKGYPSPDTRLFGRIKSFAQISGIGFSVIGAYVGGYSMILPWFVGGAILIGTAIYAHFTIQEEYFVPEIFSWKKGFKRMKDIARSSIRYGMTDTSVRFILVITFVQIFAVQPFNMYWQPFFGSHGVDKIHYGWIFAGMLSLLSVGAYIASIIKVEDGEKALIVKSQIFVGVLIVLTTMTTSLPVLIFLFLLHEVGRGFWEPVKDSYLHKRIPSHERATIDSFCSISPHIGGAIGLVVSGAIAQTGATKAEGITTAWLVSGIILIVGALLVVRNGGHKETQNKTQN